MKYIVERSLAIAEHVSRQDSMRHTKHILAIGRHLEHFLYSSCFVWKVQYIKSIISNPLSPRWYWYDAVPWQTGTSKHVWHPGPTFHRVSQPQVCFWCRSRQLWKALAGAYGRWVASNQLHIIKRPCMFGATFNIRFRCIDHFSLSYTSGCERGFHPFVLVSMLYISSKKELKHVKSITNHRGHC